MTASTSSSGADAPAVTPDGAAEVVGELVGAVDPEHPRAAGLAGELLEGPGVRGVGRADHDDGVAARRDLHERRLAVGGGEAQVAAARAPTSRGSARGWPRARRPSRGGYRVVWASSATGSSNCGERLDLGDRLDPVDGVGGDGHGADGLLVALVADVDDAVALAGPHLHLVVDLGDQRAHGVDHVAAAGLGRGHDLGGRAVGREHDRAARRAPRRCRRRRPRPRSWKRSTTSWLCTISW